MSMFCCCLIEISQLSIHNKARFGSTLQPTELVCFGVKILLEDWKAVGTQLGVLVGLKSSQLCWAMNWGSAKVWLRMVE